MFELRAEGLGIKAIARTLNTEGHKTKRDGIFTARNVQIALSNPVYAGRAGGPAIVDPATFDLVAEKARVRSGETKTGRPPTRFVLGSLAVCDACGARMTGGERGYVRKDGTKQRYYQCTASRDCLGTCDAPRLDANRIEAAVKDQLASLFIDFDSWAKEQAEATSGQRALMEAELARLRKDLAKRQRQRDRIRKAYVAKVTPANEDALEHCIAEVKAAQARADQAEAQLAALDDAPPTDAMLDVFSSLKRTLVDDTASLNERLRRIFQEFRIGLADDGETILILPVLMPDAIQPDGGRPGVIGIIDGDDYTAMKDETASADAPVMLLVPPPVRGIRIGAKGTDRLSAGS